MNSSTSSSISVKPLPPIVPGLPILGSVLDIMKDPLPFMVEAYQNWGPIYRFRILNREFTVMAGPEANRFLTKQENLLSNKIYAGISAEMKTDYFILAEDGPRHRALRKNLQRGYSKQIFASQIEKAVQITQDRLKDWRPGMSVQVVPFFKRLVTDQLGILLMNHAPGEYLSDIQMFFTNATQVNILKTHPRLFLKLPRYRRAQLRLWQLADNVIAEHRSRTPTAEQRDIVDDALDARDENGNIYPADFLRAVVLGTFTAGIDSLALTCSFAVYALLKHPGVWERVRAEILPVFKDRIPTMNEIRRLDVLHAALLEILRYYTVTPGTPRIAVEAFDFEGFHVPKDTNILVGTAVTHFLPRFFPNPMQFDIDRFIEPRHEHRQAHAFAPFALGEHTCLGAGMAEIQAMVIIGTLISNVNLELSPKYKLRIQAAPTRGPQADLTVLVKA